MIGQLLTIIKKDFKLLFRSKSSTLAVLLGPLLVVLLVGLVFTNAQDPELVVGIVSEDFENSELYVSSLEDAFTTHSYDDTRRCVRDVKQAKLVSCVVLSPGSPPKAAVHVDPSDINVVYAVIDRITGQLENQTSVLRSGFASQLLDTLTKTSVKLREDAEQLRQAELALENQVSRAQELSGELRDVQIDVSLVSTAKVQRAIDVSVNARDDYKRLVELSLEDYEELAEDVNDTARLDRIDQWYADYNETTTSLEEADDRIFAELISDLESVDDEVSSSQQRAQAFSEQARQLSNSLSSAKSDVSAVLSSIEQSRTSLSSLDISRSDITNPIEPSIEPVVSEDDNFGFLFPYFITLIVMFTGVLLASTVIVRERTSNAYFRNFTTPTPEWVFVLSTYLTTLAVLFVQLVIIYAVASFFVNFSLFSGVGTLLLLLLGVVTFFTFLGMLLGYLFKSQEGVMLAAITVSSILLFVSDLVLPTETIPGLVQVFINANPLVLSSELLKSNLLFGFSIGDVASSFLVLVLYSVVLFAAIMIVQRLARVRYFELAGAPERISAFLGEEEIPPGKELSLGEWEVSSKRELLSALEHMPDEEYEEYAGHRHNVIADWIADVYKDEKLARRLRNKSREGAISVLERET